MLASVILCGGSGTRLWPASRRAYPKQFVRFTGLRSSFQQTLSRLEGIEQALAPVVIAGENHRELILQQSEDMNTKLELIIEPEARNSGPAIAAVAAHLYRRDPQCVILVVAADHQINDAAAFQSAASVATKAANDGWIVTFGIKPDHPATGYGYIAPGRKLADGVFEVQSFVEKPDSDLAARYVLEGYLWNSGNFAFRADIFLDELAMYEPEMERAARAAAAKGTLRDGAFFLDATSFKSAPKISVDYAVMERTKKAAVVPADIGWSDLGAWDAIWAASARDGNNNSLTGDVVIVDTSGSLIRSEGVLVTAVGAHDMIVVATRDAVLVCRRDCSQSVRKLVDELERRGRPELVDFLPWAS